MRRFRQCDICREWSFQVDWITGGKLRGNKYCFECYKDMVHYISTGDDGRGTIERAAKLASQKAGRCAELTCECLSHNGFLTRKGYAAIDAQEDLFNGQPLSGDVEVVEVRLAKRAAPPPTEALPDPPEERP